MTSTPDQQSSELVKRTYPSWSRAAGPTTMVTLLLSASPYSRFAARAKTFCSFVLSSNETETGASPGPLDHATRRSTDRFELELELVATRTELQGAVRSLEIAAEEQKTINEEALSVSEEYQSTNEELLTSKEELQSLNEELTAPQQLDQLQETLERQRTTSNDLQNVLYSTDVATLFLDVDLKIRFFTPATKALFNVIPSDIGRPLADLNSLAADDALLVDALAVLQTRSPIEHEIEARSGAFYMRRISPYLISRVTTGSEGIVITFTDVTERRHTADALEVAKRQAELANVAKSRFLAAASHDLRQPLQTLVFVQGLLAKIVCWERKHKRLVAGGSTETLNGMSSMLNSLLDINQIQEPVHCVPEIVDFPNRSIAGPVEGRVYLSSRGSKARSLRRLMRPFYPLGSSSARADDPQPDFQRVEIHRPGQDTDRVPSPERKAEYRNLGHRNRHSRPRAAGDFRGISSAR